jgi:hypothetical protein
MLLIETRLFLFVNTTSWLGPQIPSYSASFHSSTVAFQRPDHESYNKIDWALIAEGNYAVVNPFDPADILYMQPKDFQIQVRVSMTQNHRLIVLAEPFSKRIDRGTEEQEKRDEDHTSSPRSPGVQESVRKFRSFLRGSEFGHILSKVGLAVLPTERNLGRLLFEWYLHITFWAVGFQQNLSRKDPRFEYFIDKCLKVLRTQGPKGLVLRLKALLYLINSCGGGVRGLTSYHTGLGIKLGPSGAPLDLHPTVRSSLARGDPSTIRTWASVANAYKVLHFDGVLDISTIVNPLSAPLPDFLLKDFRSFARIFWRKVLTVQELKSPLKARERFLKTKEIFLSTSGPNGRPGGLWAEPEAKAWEVYSLEKHARTGSKGPIHMCNPILRLTKLTGDLRLAEAFVSATQEAHFFDADQSAIPSGRRLGEFIIKHRTGGVHKIHLGKLTALEEPAGKIRIVAMPDYWTQTACKPFHTFFEEVLRRIPTDCTFDQEGGLSSYVAQLHGYNASYDLKAATDRIPVSLYRALFEECPVIGRDLASAWLDLLTDREWVESKTMLELSGRAETEVPRLLRYGVGQPMGALSSWPAMALVHHAVVQYCAYTCRVMPEGREIFPSYRLLGDDVVLGHEAVANMYKSVMSAIGVTIGLAKSYVGKSIVNFANQTYIGLTNVSPVSLREEMSISDIFGRIRLGERLVARGWIAKPAPGRGLSVPSLLRLVANPTLWREEWSKLLSAGKVRGDILVALMSWFYPNERRFSLLGIKNLTLGPLSQVLTWTKSPYGKGSLLASGRYPNDMDLTRISALYVSFLKPFKRSLEAMIKECEDATKDRVVPLKLPRVTSEDTARAKALSRTIRLSRMPPSKRFYIYDPEVFKLYIHNFFPNEYEYSIKVDRMALGLPGSRRWSTYFNSIPEIWARLRSHQYWSEQARLRRRDLVQAYEVLGNLEVALTTPPQDQPLIELGFYVEGKTDPDSGVTYRTFQGERVHLYHVPLHGVQDKPDSTFWTFDYGGYQFMASRDEPGGPVTYEPIDEIPMIPDPGAPLVDGQPAPIWELNWTVLDKVLRWVSKATPIPSVRDLDPWRGFVEDVKDNFSGLIRVNRNFHESLSVFGFIPRSLSSLSFEVPLTIEGSGAYHSGMSFQGGLRKEDLKVSNNLWVKYLHPDHWDFVPGLE